MQRARRTPRAEFGKYGNSKNEQILCIYEPMLTSYRGQMAVCQDVTFILMLITLTTLHRKKQNLGSLTTLPKILQFANGKSLAL